MKLLNQIVNVAAVKVINKAIFICFKTGDLFLNDKLLVQDVSYHSFWLKNNILYYHNTAGEHCFYDFVTHSISKGQNVIAWETLEANTAFGSFQATKGKDRWHWKSGIINIRSQAIIREYPNAQDMGLMAMTAMNYIFTTSLYHIVSISRETGDIIWRFDTFQLGFWRNLSTNSREYYEIVKKIGVIQNILWLEIKAGALLGLDVNKGQVKYFFKMPVLNSPFFEKNGYAALYSYNKTIYDSFANKLIGVNWWHYYEIDLNKAAPSLELQLFKEECLKYNTTVSHSDRRCMDETHIYFADAVNTKLVALNRTTLKIDWCYLFTGKEAKRVGTLMSVAVSDLKLYVLDHNANLFIFERAEKKN
jgi:hypothetical protein